MVDDRASADEDVTDEQDDDALSSSSEEESSWFLRRKAVEPRVGSSVLAAERQKDLSMQAALTVLRARRPLATLRDLSGNLPSLAPALSKVRLESTSNAPLVDALDSLWTSIESTRNTLTLNGLEVDLKRSDYVAHAVRIVLAESGAAAELLDTGLHPTAVSHLIQMPRPAPLRIDTRHIDTIWLNDISVDNSFRHLPSDLKAASAPGHTGVQFVRHNLFNAIITLDPGTICGALMGAEIVALLKRALPVRIGLLPRSESDGARALLLNPPCEIIS